jgi:hypothetical protein
MLGALQDRRVAVKELAATGAALVALARADLGLAQEDDVIAEGCRGGGVSCRRNNQCCSGKCKRKRRKKRNRNDNDNRKRRKKDDGVCRCLGNGKSCNKDAACCKGRCDPDSKRCRCIPRNDICNRDDDCCGKAVCRSDGARRVCQNKRRNK